MDENDFTISIDDRGVGGGHDFTPTEMFLGEGGHITLVLPQSVAEHYRQQGRRQLQSEFRDLINAERR